jgi:hypothetical protein
MSPSFRYVFTLALHNHFRSKCTSQSTTLYSSNDVQPKATLFILYSIHNIQRKLVSLL